MQILVDCSAKIKNTGRKSRLAMLVIPGSRQGETQGQADGTVGEEETEDPTDWVTGLGTVCGGRRMTGSGSVSELTGEDWVKTGLKEG